MRSRISSAVVISICFLGGASYAETGGARRANASKAQPAVKAFKLNDGEILGIADTANIAGIEEGRIAAAKAQTTAVKAFANQMVADHGAARQKVEEVSKEIGVTASTCDMNKELISSESAVIAQLKKTGPGSFDKVYMQAQVDLHKRLLRTIEDLVPQTSSTKMKALLGELRTHEQYHLALAESTLRDLG